jgi:hypothetical protein
MHIHTVSHPGASLCLGCLYSWMLNAKATPQAVDRRNKRIFQRGISHSEDALRLHVVILVPLLHNLIMTPRLTNGYIWDVRVSLMQELETIS